MQILKEIYSMTLYLHLLTYKRFKSIVGIELGLAVNLFY